MGANCWDCPWMLSHSNGFRVLLWIGVWWVEAISGNLFEVMSSFLDRKLGWAVDTIVIQQMTLDCHPASLVYGAALGDEAELVLVVGTRSMLNSVHTPILAGFARIPMAFVLSLGVLLDPGLLLDAHLATVTKNVYYQLRLV